MRKILASLVVVSMLAAAVLCAFAVSAEDAENLALGKTVTGAVASTHDQVKFYNADLTDGEAVNSMGYGNPPGEWFSYYYSEAATGEGMVNVEHSEVDGVSLNVGTFVVDLETVSTIESVRIHFNKSYLPANVLIEVSSDNASYTTFTETAVTTDSGEVIEHGEWVEFTADAATGRYVKVSLSFSGMFCMLNEIEVLGTAGADEPETSDDSSASDDEPETSGTYEEVDETIEVDGDLNDTGWIEANFTTIDGNTGTIQINNDIGDLAYEYAVRADAENIYVAVKVNLPASPCIEADTMDGKLQTGSHIRMYFTKDEDVAKYGADGAIAVLDTLLDILVESDGNAAAYKAKNVTSDIAVVVASSEEESVYEVCVPKALYDLEDVESFRLAIGYSDACFGVYGEEYNCLNDHAYETGAEPWVTNVNYTVYTFEEIELGTCLVEIPDTSDDTSDDSSDEESSDPSEDESSDDETSDDESSDDESSDDETSDDESSDEPEENYEETIAALVGDMLTDPDFEIALEATVDGNKMTVVMTVANIKEGVNMQSLTATLYYDTDRLTLLNGEVEDENDGSITLDCVTQMPVSWESLTKLTTEGEIGIRFIGVNPNKVLSDEDPLILTFNFELKDGETEAGVWVTTESVSSIYAPNDGSSNTFSYVGNGAYVIGKYVEEEESSEETSSDESSEESSEETSSEESSEAPVSSDASTSTSPDTGDAGIIVFAILAVLSVAGAFVAVRVRH